MQLTIFRPGAPEREVIEVEGETYRDVRDKLKEILGGHPDHVSVLFGDQGADMFVHETGAMDGLPVNDAATEIYWTASKRRGEQPTNDWPKIHGVAVMPDRRIWF